MDVLLGLEQQHNIEEKSSRTQCRAAEQRGKQQCSRAVDAADCREEEKVSGAGRPQIKAILFIINATHFHGVQKL